MPSLDQLGFFPFFSAQFQLLDDSADLVPARVSADSSGVYELAGCKATLGELSGRLRHALAPSQRPTAGDWVAVDDRDDRAGRAIIHRLLDRRTVLRRRAAGSDGRPQIVAANVDLFFVVTSANRDLNPRRLERYLTAVWDSGARPVIVLNKIDLVDDPAPLRERIEAVSLATPVVEVSAHTGVGAEGLWGFIEPGLTIGFVGSSGVGKSSLVNRLLGHDTHATEALRSDGKGRHTTTRRQLIVLPQGGVLIDTPGMREFGLVAAGDGLDAAFAELIEIGEECRFRDCRHHDEPGCAVREAVASGRLPAERLASYQALLTEQAKAEARRDPAQVANTKRRWKAIHKRMRAHYKHGNKGHRD
ncbi:ribosome small subunit-dependent GTPase A [Haliangium sp.]|uniref:ribosome small subunit-dependent GTPase A n=1 Tax=Haliangium sp. TaxID=2663208 RepID=UPI003D0A9CA0